MNADTIAEGRVISIDYSMSLEAMIAAGNYDWKNDNIAAEKFPVEGTGIGQFETKIFHFDRYLSSDDAVAAIKDEDRERPWEPAKIEHLLAFGAAHPDEQRKYPIIGLGSVAEVYGLRLVPYLYEGGARRDLGLGWWDDDWDGDYRFLAVRQQSLAA
jgi:hypothetical protein